DPETEQARCIVREGGRDEDPILEDPASAEDGGSLRHAWSDRCERLAGRLVPLEPTACPYTGPGDPCVREFRDELRHYGTCVPLCIQRRPRSLFRPLDRPDRNAEGAGGEDPEDLGGRPSNARGAGSRPRSCPCAPAGGC